MGENFKDLRPRIHVPNYRETSPEKIILNNKVYKLKRKPICKKIKLCKKSRRTKKYQLRVTEKKPNSSDSFAEKPNEDKRSDDEKIPEKSKNKNRRKPYQHNIEDVPNTDDSNQKGNENGRRYPVRLRRKTTEVYSTDAKPTKRQMWNDSLLSPMDKMREDKHYWKRDAYQKKLDTDDSDDHMKDEMKFEKKRMKSLFRARAELKPINRVSRDFMSELIHDNSLNGTNILRSNRADIEPMLIDKSITFASVGGNKHCIQALKESIILPLMYPEVFKKLSIAPPRGLLFHGPPGSGKTLLARALVNECQLFNGKKIAFFMRKGADCLSKWVGESERQLRLLFDQAYRMKPAIIFFDEIDGLAPVRSSRQDQIHSSIVSTLLSLIDGLDDRGEIIVIGATNRIDAIDPALRRPGRFDREFLFTLPDKETRKEILTIHTSNWKPRLSNSTIDYITQYTNGYSGADLKAVVVEAGLCSLRRRYPQIYKHPKKLKLDLKQIKVTDTDINTALRIIRPSHERATLQCLYTLPDRILKLLDADIQKLTNLIVKYFNNRSNVSLFSEIYDQNRIMYKPRIFLTGFGVEELTTAVLNDLSGIKILKFDSISIASSSLQSLSTSQTNPSGNQSNTTSNLMVHNIEDRLYQIFLEAERNHQSIILLSNIDIIFHSLDLTGQYLLYQLITRPNISSITSYHQSHPNAINTMNQELTINDSESESLIIIMATLSSAAQNLYDELDEEFSITDVLGNDIDPRSHMIWKELAEFLVTNSHRQFNVEYPTYQQRYDYFSCLMNEPVTSQQCITTQNKNDCDDISKSFMDTNVSADLEELSEAETEMNALAADEIKKLELEEEIILRKFRMSLRKIVSSLAKEKKFQLFLCPVEKADYPDYYKVITNPMDLSTVRHKIDLHSYKQLDEFKSDLNLISVNALFYNPPRTSYLRDIRRHAYDFVDYAECYIDENISPEFIKVLQELEAARINRDFYSSTITSNTNQTNTASSSTSSVNNKQEEEIGEYLAEVNAGTKLTKGPLLNSQIDVYHKFYKPSQKPKSSKPPNETINCTKPTTRAQQQQQQQHQFQQETNTPRKSQSDSELMAAHSLRNNKERSQSVGATISTQERKHNTRKHKESQESEDNISDKHGTKRNISALYISTSDHPNKSGCKSAPKQSLVGISSAPIGQSSIISPIINTKCATLSIRSPNNLIVSPISLNIDHDELIDVCKEVANKTEHFKRIRHFEDLYFRLLGEIRDFKKDQNKNTTLYQNLRKIIDLVEY